MGSEIIVVPAIFIGLPWVILHFITKWKTMPTLTDNDERTLSELHEMARYMEERLETIERIVAADNPGWSPRALSQDNHFGPAAVTHGSDGLRNPQIERNH